MYEYLSMLFAINYNFIFNLLRIHSLLEVKLLPQIVWPRTAKKKVLHSAANLLLLFGTTIDNNLANQLFAIICISVFVYKCVCAR